MLVEVLRRPRLWWLSGAADESNPTGDIGPFEAGVLLILGVLNLLVAIWLHARDVKRARVR